MITVAGMVRPQLPARAIWRTRPWCIPKRRGSYTRPPLRPSAGFWVGQHEAKMTLMTAIVGGLACGYFLGVRPSALAVFVAIWVVVLIFQTFVALDAADVPPEAWSYVPVQVVILALGTGMIWVGMKARAR